MKPFFQIRKHSVENRRERVNQRRQKEGKDKRRGKCEENEERGNSGRHGKGAGKSKTIENLYNIYASSTFSIHSIAHAHSQHRQVTSYCHRNTCFRLQKPSFATRLTTRSGNFQTKKLRFPSDHPHRPILSLMPRWHLPSLPSLCLYRRR